MTFQPPPPSEPPGSAPPPPPPPSPYGGGSGGNPAFDPKSVNPLDWGIVAAGVLAFILSFPSFYTGSVDTSGTCSSAIQAAADNEDTGSASAWHEIFGGGFFAWFAMLFAIAGAVVVAMSLLAPQVKLPVPNRLAGLGLFAAATLFEIIAIFVTPGDSASQSFGGCTVEVGVGHGFGFWASLIVILAGLVLSLMRFQATGGQLPGQFGNKVPNIGGYGPQDRPAPGPGSTPPAPPSNYGPPQ